MLKKLTDKKTAKKKPKKPPERSTKLTKPTKKQANQETFLESYKANTFNITEACKDIGITRTIYYKWLEDETFAKQVEVAREELVDIVESALLKKIREGNMTAIIFFLKCQAKSRGYIEAPPKDESVPEKIDWTGIGSVFAKIAGSIAITPPPNQDLIEHAE